MNSWSPKDSRDIRKNIGWAIILLNPFTSHYLGHYASWWINPELVPIYVLLLGIAFLISAIR